MSVKRIKSTIRGIVYGIGRRNPIARKYLATRWQKMLVKESKAAGVSDFNQYFDMRHNYESATMVSEIIRCIGPLSGEILEVGAGIGRWTRELQKHAQHDATIISIECNEQAFDVLTNYVAEKQYENVKTKLTDYYNNDFENEAFDVVLIPWFDMTQRLFEWSLTIKEASRILKKNGLLIFDFMDSKDATIEYIATPDKACYFLVNGDDIERIANHFGFVKLHEFVNTCVVGRKTLYRIYQKRDSCSDLS